MIYSPRPFERLLTNFIVRQTKIIEQLINQFVFDATAATERTRPSTEGDFYFRNYPALSRQVDTLLHGLSQRLTRTIQAGSEWSWELANAKNDNMLGKILDSIGRGRVPASVLERWNQKNLPALEAFEKRRIGGMKLSDRVWSYTKNIKGDLELALDLGLGQGMSADRLSMTIRQFLKEPARLYRRVRDEKGVLRLSKSAAQYHPGQGVYRSSYKNAKRLAVTETNMAYRTADNERAQQIDFILGIEIHISDTNHTCLDSKGVPQPFHDICDDLQGRYPKWFVFKGWHPNCRCYVTTILPDRKEMIKYLAAMDENGHSSYKLQGEVTEMPKQFTDWVQANSDRIERAQEKGTLPYFLKDNRRAWDASYVPTEEQKRANILEQARIRHESRTPEQEEEIRARARARAKAISAGQRYIEEFGDVPGIDISALRDAYEHGRWGEVHTEAIKLAQRKRLVLEHSIDMLNAAKEYGEVDVTALRSALKSGKYAQLRSESLATEVLINRMKAAEESISNLIPNAHELHKSYSLAELQQAHRELDGVMNKWLSKYSYSSLDKAPLEHLKNKLAFELSDPTINYSNKELIKKIINENIRITDQKIIIRDLTPRIDALRSFKTKSSVFKGAVRKIDDAVKRGDISALGKAIEEAEKKQSELLRKKGGGDLAGALNPEYKGGAVGKDMSANIDVRKMTSEDPYRGTFTNNVARMQGFDAPAKLVSEREFEMLEKQYGDVFYRTVNPTNFKGKSMSSKEFADQLWKAEKLELNGPGGRAYGDGMYVATSAWDGYKVNTLTGRLKREARNESLCYGSGRHTISEMAWTRKPKIIQQDDLRRLWYNLTDEQRRKFGNQNTLGCALGYDAMYCSSANYMVIWNRSIIAVKKV